MAPAVQLRIDAQLDLCAMLWSFPLRSPMTSNVVFSCELTWRGPCVSTDRDKADRRLQNSVIRSLPTIQLATVHFFFEPRRLALRDAKSTDG